MTQTAYLGLGANLPSAAGLPLQTLQAAARDLAKLGHIKTLSSLYETEPVSDIPQPPFLNAALALQTSLTPPELMQHLLAIEERFGRKRLLSQQKGPRTLDLDLLLQGSTILNTPALVLPHPHLHERRFVLAPLAEIAPDLKHPLLAKMIATLLSELPNQGTNTASAVRRVQDASALALF